MSSLRVVGHPDWAKSALWKLADHPLYDGPMALELVYSMDSTSDYAMSWYLAVPDRSAAKRDSTSTYLSVTEDPQKAAVVHVV